MPARRTSRTGLVGQAAPFGLDWPPVPPLSVRRPPHNTVTVFAIFHTVKSPYPPDLGSNPNPPAFNPKRLHYAPDWGE